VCCLWRGYWPVFGLTADVLVRLSVHTPGHTTLMRNITLSAADQLIDQARDKARAQGVTLNDEFRKWLASYVQAGDRQSAVNR